MLNSATFFLSSAFDFLDLGMDDIEEETTGQRKTRTSKASRTSVESENEMQADSSDPMIKNIESERLLLEKENEERYAKLKKLKEEERAATEALKAQGTFYILKEACDLIVICYVYFFTEFGMADGDKKSRKRRSSSAKKSDGKLLLI